MKHQTDTHGTDMQGNEPIVVIGTDPSNHFAIISTSLLREEDWVPGDVLCLVFPYSAKPV